MRQAFAEDFRRLGLALMIAAVVGGLFQEQVAAGMTYGGLIVGTILWMIGLAVTGTGGEQ